MEIFWQVVNPEQASKIHLALKKKGLPVALVEYEGESHGFRKVSMTEQLTIFLNILSSILNLENISEICSTYGFSFA